MTHFAEPHTPGPWARPASTSHTCTPSPREETTMTTTPHSEERLARAALATDVEDLIGMVTLEPERKG